MRGTILAYRDDPERPVAEVQLASGERVRIRLHAGGMVIDAMGTSPAAAIVRADADQVARLCAGLLAPGRRRPPLALLAALVGGAASVAGLRRAFEAALEVLDR